MKNKWFLTTLACMAIGCAAQAATVTWDFQDHGTGDLGVTTDTFTSTAPGTVITATSSGPNLFVKNDGGDEMGLGLARTLDNEINVGQYIALVLPTVPSSTVTGTLIASVQLGESAEVWWGATPGTKTTLLGTVSDSDNSVTFSETTGAITIFATAGNVLLASVSADVTVPDGGTTVALLGCAMAALGLIRRKLIA